MFLDVSRVLMGFAELREVLKCVASDLNSTSLCVTIGSARYSPAEASDPGRMGHGQVMPLPGTVWGE